MIELRFKEGDKVLIKADSGIRGAGCIAEVIQIRAGLAERGACPYEVRFGLSLNEQVVVYDHELELIPVPIEEMTPVQLAQRYRELVPVLEERQKITSRLHELGFYMQYSKEHDAWFFIKETMTQELL